MKITKPRKRVKIEDYCRNFDYADSPGGGFGFKCNSEGHISEQWLGGNALRNLRGCLAGEIDGHKIIDKGVIDFSKWWVYPAEGNCDVCQKTVVLDSTWASCCEGCGSEYSGRGQLLAPRSQWGEETGERFV